MGYYVESCGNLLCVIVFSYRRFGTVYSFHLQEACFPEISIHSITLLFQYASPSAFV